MDRKEFSTLSMQLSLWQNTADAEKAMPSVERKLKPVFMKKEENKKNHNPADQENHSLNLSQYTSKQFRTLKILHFQKHLSTHKGPWFLHLTAKLSDVTQVTRHMFGKFPFSCPHHHWDLMQVTEILQLLPSSILGVTLPLTFKWPLCSTSCLAWNSKRAEKHPSVAGISYTFQILPSLFGSFHASSSQGHGSQAGKLLDRYTFLNWQQQRKKKKLGRDNHPISLRMNTSNSLLHRNRWMQRNAAMILFPDFEARLESTKYSPCITFCGIMSAVICRPESLCKGTIGK